MSEQLYRATLIWRNQKQPSHYISVTDVVQEGAFIVLRFPIGVLFVRSDRVDEVHVQQMEQVTESSEPLPSGEPSPEETSSPDKIL